MDNNTINYGCMFCRSGSEERIIEELKRSQPMLRCISPKRVRVRRTGAKDFDTLIPGYIFFKTECPVDFKAITDKNDVFRLLKYSNGNWQLYGSDLQIAQMLFEIGGTIGLSKARFEDGKVVMQDGPLKIYEDRIINYNKRAQTAQLLIGLYDTPMTIWLGFEIDKNDE